MRFADLSSHNSPPVTVLSKVLPSLSTHVYIELIWRNKKRVVNPKTSEIPISWWKRKIFPVSIVWNVPRKSRPRKEYLITPSLFHLLSFHEEIQPCGSFFFSSFHSDTILWQMVNKSSKPRPDGIVSVSAFWWQLSLESLVTEDYLRDQAEEVARLSGNLTSFPKSSCDFDVIFFS